MHVNVKSNAKRKCVRVYVCVCMCVHLCYVVYVRVNVSSNATRKLELQGKIQLSGPSQEKSGKRLDGLALSRGKVKLVALRALEPI